jgi:hypothetical protein
MEGELMFTKKIAWSSVIVAFLTPSIGFAQEVIAQCGASKGKAYYSEPKDHGWVDDGISDGNITFIKDSSGKYDVIIKHSTGVMSAKQDGATVVATHATKGRLSLVVVYPLATVEVYQLAIQANGKGTLLWTSSKNGIAPVSLTRIAAFKSECST